MLQAGLTLVTVKLVIVGLLDLLHQPDGDARARQGGDDARRRAAARPARRRSHRSADHQRAADADGGRRASPSRCQRNLFAVVVLGGIYSFLMATVLVALDAVDVAMTEASVGAGMSTVLLLAALYLVQAARKRSRFAGPRCRWWSAVAIGGALVYGTLGLPAFSDPTAPIHTHVAPRYLNDARPRDRRAQRRDRGAGELSRLRHARRDDGGVHGRRRRDRAAAPAAARRRRGRGQAMRHDLILRVVAKIMIPFMLLFALYVQFHGDFGPGGGFQAGVIIAAAIIFYAHHLRLPTARRVVPDRLVETHARRRRADLCRRRRRRAAARRQLSSTTSCSTTIPSTASSAASSGSRSACASPSPA